MATKNRHPPLSIGLAYIPHHAKPELHVLHSEGRRLLRLIDTWYFPLTPGSALEIATGGRPFFTDHHADFSISHSRNMVVVGYAPAGFVTHIGCDIQGMDGRKNIEGIAKRAFSAAEQEFLVSAADSVERLTRFYQIWTFKESYIKLYGLSVFDILKAPDFTSKQENIAFCHFCQYQLGTVAAARYMVCCMWKCRECGEAEIRPEIRWFSKPFSP
jgi:phosphopantetheinyl transferase